MLSDIDVDSAVPKPLALENVYSARTEATERPTVARIDGRADEHFTSLLSLGRDD